VKHAPPQKQADDEKPEPPPRTPIEDQIVVAAVVALLTLLYCYHYTPPPPPQPVPCAAATPKNERRGTVLSPTRRGSAEEREGTAAAADDQPAVDLAQAATAVQAQQGAAPQAPAAVASEQDDAAQQQHANELQQGDLPANEPDASSAGAPDASADRLQPHDDVMGELDSQPDDTSAVNGNAAAELDTEAAVDDRPKPDSASTGHSAQRSSGLVGVTGESMATSAPLAPVAAATASAAAEQQQAAPIVPGSLALPLEDAETRSNSSSSAESDASPVSPTLAPTAATDSITSSHSAAADLLLRPKSPCTLTSSLGEAFTATLATTGAAQQRTAPTDMFNATPVLLAPTAATAASTTGGAGAGSATSNDRIVALYDELSDGASDVEDEHEEPIDDSAAAPLSSLSTGSAAFPGGGSDTDDDLDVDAHLYYYEPVWTAEEVRAYFDAADPLLYGEALEICGAERVHLQPTMSMSRTYAERNLYELMDLFEELDLPNTGGSLPLRHVPLHPALASPAVPAAAAVAVAPEQEEAPEFHRTLLPSIREDVDDAASESDMDSDVDSDNDGDAPQGLLDHECSGNAPPVAATTGTAVARDLRSAPAQRASDAGSDVSSDVASDVDSGTAAASTTAAATTDAPGTTGATTASPCVETAAPLAQSPTAAANGTANGRADVASETRLAESKRDYMAAVNQGLAAAEMRELNALPGGIRSAWERTAPFGIGGLFLWHVPGNEQEYDADVTKKRAELKRAHKHLRETTLSTAEAHWEALVAKVTARLSGNGFTASLAAVLNTLQFVQCAAITALRLEDYEIDDIKANRARNYGHYLDIPTAPAPPSTSGKRQLRLAGYDDAANLFNMVQ
jgi:hypothetical protein